MVPQQHTISLVYVTSGLFKFTKRNTSAFTEVRNLTLRSGQVEIASSAVVDDLILTSGTLTINDQLSVTTSWFWTGGRVQGTGDFTVSGKAEVNTTSYVYLYLYVKQFTLHGTFIPRGPATLYTQSAQQVTVASDGLMTLRGDFRIQTSTFNNWGQIDYGAEIGGTARIDGGMFNNYGLVTVGAQNKSVTLVLTSGGTIGGTYTVVEGSTLNLAPSSNHIDDDLNGLITGEGTLLISGSRSYTTTLRSADIDIILVQSSTLNLQPNKLRIGNVTVRGGNCVINAFTFSLYVASMEVSSGSLTVSAPVECDSLTVTGGTIDLDADLTIHKTSSFIGGTIRGNGYNIINASVLQFESRSSSYSSSTYVYLYSITVHVWNMFVARSHQLQVYLYSGTQLKLDSKTTDISGSYLTFETDGTGVIENYRFLSILVSRLHFNVGLHNFGTIYVNNSDIYLSQPSTCSGTFDVAINSTMSISNTLSMTADGKLIGSGELKVTGGYSRLFGVSVQTLTIRGGSTVLNLDDQRVKDVQVDGGTLEIKTSYRSSQQDLAPRRVDRILVVRGTLENDDTFLINELLIRGGTLQLNADSYVYGVMHWSAGYIQGQTYSQVALGVTGKMNIIGTGTRYLRSCKLVIASEGVWRGSSSIYLYNGGSIFVGQTGHLLVDGTSFLQSGDNCYAQNALTNDGKITVQRGRQFTVNVGFSYSGTTVVQYSATLTLTKASQCDSGSLYLEDGSTLTMSGGEHYISPDCSVSHGNTTTLQLLGGRLTARSLPATGNVIVKSGLLTIHNVGSAHHIGNLQVLQYGRAVISVAGYDRLNPLSIDNVTVDTRSSSYYLEVNSYVKVGQFILKTGTVRSSSDFNISHFEFQSGYLTATIRTNVYVSRSLLLAGTTSASRYLQNNQLILDGTANWNGSSSYLYLQSGAQLIIRQNGNITIESTQQISSDSSGALINYGKIEFIPFAEFPGVLTISSHFANFGTLSVVGHATVQHTAYEMHSYKNIEILGENSTLRVSSSVTFHRGGRLIGDGLLLAYSGKTTFESQTTTLRSIEILYGQVMFTESNGQLALSSVRLKSSSGRLEVSGSLVTETLYIEHGLVEVKSDMNVTSLANVSNGNLISIGNTVCGHLIWYGGYLSGSGTISAQSATVLYTNVNHYLNYGTTLELTGRTEIVGRPFAIYVYGGAKIINKERGLLHFTDGQGVRRSSSQTVSLINYGHFQYDSAENASSVFSISVNNYGTLMVSSGLAAFQEDFTNVGALLSRQGSVVECSKLTNSHGSTILVEGELRLSSPGSTIIASVFKVHQLGIYSGSNTLDLLRGSGHEIRLLNIRGGTLSIPGDSDELNVWTGTISSGTLTSWSPITFSNRLTVLGGHFETYNRVNISTFAMTQGTVSGTTEQGPIYADMLEMWDISGQSKDISGKGIVIVKDGLWTGAASTTTSIRNGATLTIERAASLNITHHEAARVTGDGNFINQGQLRLGTLADASPGTVVFYPDVVNTGTITITENSRILLKSIESCKGSIVVSPYAQLEIERAHASSCVFSGSQVKVLSGGQLHVGDSVQGNLHLQSLVVAGGDLVVEGADVNIGTLIHSSGTIRGAHANATLTIRTLYQWTGGYINGLTVKTDGKLAAFGSSLNLQAATLQVNGSAEIISSTFIFRDNSVFHVTSSGSITAVGQVILRTSGSKTGVFVNYGARTSVANGGTFDLQNVIARNYGTLIAAGYKSVYKISSYSSSLLGTVSLTGIQSELSLYSAETGSRHILYASSSSCSSCQLVLYDGELQFQRHANVQGRISYVKIQSGLVTFKESNADRPLTVDEMLVTGSRSTLQLSPIASIRQLTIENSGSVQGNSTKIGRLIYRHGYLGASSGLTSYISTQTLVFDSKSSKTIRLCHVTVTQAASVNKASFRLSSGSRLEIASNANMTFQSDYLYISSSNSGTSTGGEIVNYGLIYSSMFERTDAIVSSHITNAGTLQVFKGKLRLQGTTTHTGAVTVDEKGILVFEGSGSHTTTTASIISVRGLLHFRSASSVLQYSSVSLAAVLLESGTLESKSTGCVDRLNVTGGELKASSPTAVNVFGMSSGKITATSTLSVNGIASWTGGTISKSGSGQVYFNGKTTKSSSVSGSPTIVNPDTSCPTTSCTKCLSSASCAWYVDANACRLKISFSNNSASSCQSWITASGKCPANNQCKDHREPIGCNSDTKCSWCAATLLCLTKQSQTCVTGSSTSVAYWTKQADGTWSEKTSWSTGNIPTSSHNVFVSVSRTITVTTTGTVSLKSLTVGSIHGVHQPTVEIASATTVGTLKVLLGATLSVRRSLTWTGTATIQGTVVWNPSYYNYKLTGGYLDIYGSLFVLGSYTRYLYSHIRLHGRGYVKADGSHVYLTSNKQLQIMSGGELEVASNGYFSRSGTGSQIINDGTFTVSTAPSTSFYVQIPTTSSGLINITSGSGLRFSYGATISGRVHVQQSSVLYLTGSAAAVLQQKSSVTGNGTVDTAASTTIQTTDINLGKLRVRASVSVTTPVSIQSLDMMSGTLSCLADVNVTTIMEWTGGQLSGPNKLTVLGELNMRSSLGLTNGHLVIANQAYTFPLISSLTISTSGVSSITTAVGAIWDMSQIYYFNIYPKVINNGTLISSPRSYVRLRGGLVNAGDLLVFQNTLYIYQSSATALNDSKITVYENAVMYFSSSQSSSFDLTSNITINGQLTLSGSRLNIKSLSMKCNGRLQASSSTLTIYDTVQLEFINSLTVSSSTVVINSHKPKAGTSEISPSATRIGRLYISSGSSSVTLGGGTTIDYCSLLGTLQIGPSSGSSDGTVINVGVLEWLSGTVTRRTGTSGKPQIRIRQLNQIATYSSTIYFKTMELVLLKAYWQVGRYAYVYFQESDVIISSGYNVEMAFQGYNYWYFQRGTSNSRLVVNGTANFTSASGTARWNIGIPLEVHGEFNVGKDVQLQGTSYVRGKLRSNGGNLILLSGVHTWADTSFVGDFPEIRVQGSARLSINSRSTNILLLSLFSSASVTVDGNRDLAVSTVLLTGGVFQCSQDCVIDNAIYWRGGTIRTTHNNASVIAGPNCTVTTMNNAYYYLGPGRLVVQGRLAFDQIYRLTLYDELVIDNGGRTDVYYPTSIVNGNVNGHLLVKETGTVRIHHGVQWTVSTPFYNEGRMIVEGFVRVYGYQTRMGYHRGVLSLPVPYGTFATNGYQGTFNFTSSSRVTGVGVIKHERGTLLINTDLDSSGSFKGTVHLAGGTIEIPSTTVVNISSVTIRSGTLKLTNTGYCHVNTLYHTGGILLASGAGRFTVGKMTVRYATIQGTQDIRVTQSMIWDRSVTVRGPGLRLYIEGFMVASGTYQSTIDTGAEVIVATNNAIYRTRFLVDGVLRIAQGGILRMQPGSDVSYYRTVGSLANDGQLVIEALESPYVQIDVYMDNKGLVDIRTGRLWLYRYAGQIVGGLGGVFRGSRGTILHVGGSTTFSSNVSLELQDGTLRIEAVTYIYSNISQVTVSQLQIYGGTLFVFAPLGLKVLGDMTLRSTLAIETTMEVRRIFLNGYIRRRGPNATLLVEELQWRSGSIQSTPYKVTDYWLTVSRLLSMSNSYHYVDGCGILSTGTTTMATGGRLQLRYQSVFRNDGNMTIDQTGSSIYNSGRLINGGDLQIDVGISGSVSIPISLINYGHLRVVTGQLYLYGTNYYHHYSTITVIEEAILQFSGGSHRFTAGSVVDVHKRASVVVSGGTVEFLPNSTATQFYQLTVSGGYFTAHRGSFVSKIDILTNPYRGGYITLNSTIVVVKAVLTGGTTTVGGRVKFNRLLSSGHMLLQGGRRQERAILQVDDFTYTGGTIRTWSSTGRYFVVNVSRSMLIDNHYQSWLYWRRYFHYLERCDLINYGTATAAFVTPFSIQNGARLINAASGRIVLKYAYFQGSGILLNYGHMSFGSSNAINLNVRLILAGGTIRVDNKELLLQNGGSCNASDVTVEVAEDSELQIRGGTFQCQPNAIKGLGTVRVNGGTLQLTSGELIQYVEVNSGTVFIPTLQNVQFSNRLRLIGGAVKVDGKANFSREFNFERGSLQGGGILIVAKQATLQTTGYLYNSRSVYLQIQNHGLMNLAARIYFYGLGRNEKTGTAQMTGVTEIYGNGGLDNVGHLICTAHFGSRCYVASPFRNYRHLELESGDLVLTSRAQLFDGCKVSGSGRLVTNSQLYVGGMSYSSIVARSGVYITSPFFSYGSFAWLSGSMQTTVYGCASPYNAGNPYLNPLCEEAYFMNEGSMTISGNGYKEISTKSLFINRGQLMWSAYGSFGLYGTIVNTESGVCTVYRDTLSSYSVSSSGNITNYGTFNIDWTNMYMYYITFENYGSLNLKQSSAYLNYRVFTQDGANSTLQLMSGRLQASSLQLRNGVLRGYGTVRGPVNNIAGTVEPILPADATPSQLTVSSTYSQQSSGKLKIGLRKREKSVVSGMLAVQRAILDGPLYIAWDGHEVTDKDVKAGPLPAVISYQTRTGNFSAVYETEDGLVPPQIAIGVSFNSTHGVLKSI
jgi:hypothetical protein